MKIAKSASTPNKFTYEMNDISIVLSEDTQESLFNKNWVGYGGKSKRHLRHCFVKS